MMKWRKGDSIPCANCGKEAFYEPSGGRRGKGKFVCRDCGEEHRFLSDVASKSHPRKVLTGTTA